MTKGMVKAFWWVEKLAVQVFYRIMNMPIDYFPLSSAIISLFNFFYELAKNVQYKLLP